MWSDYGVTSLEDPVTYTETYAETYVLYLVLCSHTRRAHGVYAFAQVHKNHMFVSIKVRVNP